MLCMLLPLLLSMQLCMLLGMLLCISLYMPFAMHAVVLAVVQLPPLALCLYIYVYVIGVYFLLSVNHFSARLLHRSQLPGTQLP